MGLFSIYAWEKNWPLRENITFLTPSLIDWDFEQPEKKMTLNNTTSIQIHRAQVSLSINISIDYNGSWWNSE